MTVDEQRDTDNGFTEWLSKYAGSLTDEVVNDCRSAYEAGVRQARSWTHPRLKACVGPDGRHWFVLEDTGELRCFKGSAAAGFIYMGMITVFEKKVYFADMQVTGEHIVIFLKNSPGGGISCKQYSYSDIVVDGSTPHSGRFELVKAWDLT